MAKAKPKHKNQEKVDNYFKAVDERLGVAGKPVFRHTTDKRAYKLDGVRVILRIWSLDPQVLLATVSTAGTGPGGQLVRDQMYNDRNKSGTLNVTAIARRMEKVAAEVAAGDVQHEAERVSRQRAEAAFAELAKRAGMPHTWSVAGVPFTGTRVGKMFAKPIAGDELEVDVTFERLTPQEAEQVLKLAKGLWAS